MEPEVSDRSRSPYIAESVASCAGSQEPSDDLLLFAIQANQSQQHNLKMLPAAGIACSGLLRSRIMQPCKSSRPKLGDQEIALRWLPPPYSTESRLTNRR